MKTINSDSFEGLAKSAAQVCAGGPVQDLLLHGDFTLKELDTPFYQTFQRSAESWQQPTKPQHLFINHGEYIHRHGDGLTFLVEELRRKPDSNRAVLSLIDMKDIIRSGDTPIPSFMILQVSFASTGFRHLQVSCYFRALEVTRFLPINLAEVCTMLRYLKQHFAQLETFSFTLHAFRAYANPDFHCLERAPLDSATAPVITKTVLERDMSQIRSWLDSKLIYDESAISIEGLATLVEALKLAGNDYPGELRQTLGEALQQMTELKRRRETSSHAPDNKALADKVRELLSAAKTYVK